MWERRNKQMTPPTNTDILMLLGRLATEVADDLESEVLDFKPWTDAKADMRVAVEYAVCFANAGGGVIVFGVADRVRGRAAAIHGIHGVDLDVWRRGIYEATRPNLKVQVEELPVPEGTGTLLVVRVPAAAPGVLHGTAQGLFKKRVGKNCMPVDPASLLHARVSSGVVDWSGQFTTLTWRDLDSVEIARSRNILRRINPESDLLRLADEPYLVALGALRRGEVTHTGLLLFGREEHLADLCPQHQVHYVHQTSETKVARNEPFKQPLLNILERIEQYFTGPANPERELTVGLFKLRIPTYSIESVREAILNAVTHRDYSNTGEVLIRHTSKELVITSPGGFIGGITPQTILRSEPVSRNRTLAEAFEKLRLVERAGVGRRRIFLPTLSYGKRPPVYETDGTRVTLHIFDGSYDARMAALVAEWKQEGVEMDLDGLLVLSHLRRRPFIDTKQAAELLQAPRDVARGILEQLTLPPTALLERRGRAASATFHLSKRLASDLIGKGAYTRTKGLSPIRYAEMVKEFLRDHSSITPKQCRELLGWGESATDRVEISKQLRKWSGPEGFLKREGKPPKVCYVAR